MNPNHDSGGYDSYNGGILARICSERELYACCDKVCIVRYSFSYAGRAYTHAQQAEIEEPSLYGGYAMLGFGTGCGIACWVIELHKFSARPFDFPFCKARYSVSSGNRRFVETRRWWRYAPRWCVGSFEGSMFCLKNTVRYEICVAARLALWYFWRIKTSKQLER